MPDATVVCFAVAALCVGACAAYFAQAGKHKGARQRQLVWLSAASAAVRPEPEPEPATKTTTIATQFIFCFMLSDALTLNVGSFSSLSNCVDFTALGCVFIWLLVRNFSMRTI